MYVKTSDTTTSADRELERRVENYLWGRHVPGLRRLIVSASNGTVTLQGRVRTYYEKQLAAIEHERRFAIEWHYQSKARSLAVWLKRYIKAARKIVARFLT